MGTITTHVETPTLKPFCISKVNIVQSTFTQYTQVDYYCMGNGIKPQILISSHNKVRVSPSSQELRKLLTHEGARHHNDINMNVKWMIVRVHVQIHN